MNNIKKIIGLFIYKFSFTRNNRVVFMSYSGCFSDNPKYIYEAMKKLNNRLEIIWLIDKKKVSCIPKKIKIVNYGSLLSYYYCGTAKFIIDNVHGINNTDLSKTGIIARIGFNLLTWLRTKRKQILYSTWHGAPLKKIGRDQVNSSIIDCSCPNTKFILGDKYTMEILDRMHFNKVQFKLIGCPRNDILHSDKEQIMKIKNKIGLPENKKIVLFAPTFRTSDGDISKDILRSGINQINQINFKKLFNILNSRFGGDWVFIGRFHYHVEKMINWNRLVQQYNGMIINGNQYDDMAEYLACADVLITDASSCMFDYMVTGKPIFLYFQDYDYYINHERGLYIDIDRLPFPFAKNFDELYYNIEHFDEKKYESNEKKLEKKFQVIVDNNASEKVARYILEENNLL